MRAYTLQNGLDILDFIVYNEEVEVNIRYTDDGTRYYTKMPIKKLIDTLSVLIGDYNDRHQS